jgi:DNA polymerase-3 subunit delta
LAGPDLHALAGELEKLMLYGSGGKTIASSDVDDLVRTSRQHSIFELTGALGRRDRRAAIKLIGNLLNSGEPPLLIVTMMARHFRQVIIVRELLDKGRRPTEIQAAAGIPRFLLEDFIRQSRQIDSKVAHEMLIRLGQADLQLKSTGASPRLILELLVSSV